MVVRPWLGGSVCLEIEVADNIVGGDGCESLCCEGDVVGGGVGCAVEERHELEERRFVGFWYGHGGW